MRGRRLRTGELGRRWNRNVPVIVLAPPEADPVDRVRPLERGADDVIARPFPYDELVARIRAVLRRTTPNPHDRIDAGEIVVDRRTRHVFVRSTPVRLAGREFDLAVKLASEPLRVWTKEELLRDVWALPVGIGDPHCRLARVAAAAETLSGGHRPLRRQRVGDRLPTAGVASEAWLLSGPVRPPGGAVA